MFPNLDLLIQAKETELQGINLLLEAVCMTEGLPAIPKLAGGLKDFLEKPNLFDDTVDSRLRLLDKPGAMAGVKKDIEELKSDSEGSPHRGVIHYLEAFYRLLHDLPDRRVEVMKFLKDIGVPVSGPNPEQRFGFMLDHVMDMYTNRGEEKAVEWTEGRGKPEYSQRILRMLDLMAKEQHRYASTSI
jgi:hypothetical protein